MEEEPQVDTLTDPVEEKPSSVEQHAKIKASLSSKPPEQKDKIDGNVQFTSPSITSAVENLAKVANELNRLPKGPTGRLPDNVILALGKIQGAIIKLSIKGVAT